MSIMKTIDAYPKTWEGALELVNVIVDKLGMPVDQGIKPLVAAMRMHGFRTLMSCEGHLDRGHPYPWVSFNSMLSQFDGVPFDELSEDAREQLKELGQLEAARLQQHAAAFFDEILGKGVINYAPIVVRETMFRYAVIPHMSVHLDSLLKGGEREEHLLLCRTHFSLFAVYLRRICVDQ